MRYIFRFPDIGEGISEGKILKWYVEKGQHVDVGDPIVEMETDKVVADIPSPREGVVVNKFGKIGEVINVGDPLIEIEIEGVSGEEAQKIAEEKPIVKKEEPIEEKGFGVVGTLEVAGDAAFLPSSNEGASERILKPETRRSNKVLASPVARAMARQLGIEITDVKGSGPGGRIMKDDIRAYQHGMQIGKTAEKKSAADTESGLLTEIVDLSQIRKTIAKNMIVSKHNAAHMTVIEEVEISELVRIRNSHKEKYAASGTRLTYLPFILKATVAALKKHPTLNSQLDMEGGRLILKKYYNIGIAVDTENGLMVPVIRSVDQKSIMELSLEIGEIAEKTRNRKLTLEDLKEGTFTVTNYGSIGGLFGVPVINYPQAAILGIGRIHKKPVVKNDEIKIGWVLPLSMSVDHRIVDGGEASRFINTVMGFLSDPVSLILE